MNALDMWLKSERSVRAGEALATGEGVRLFGDSAVSRFYYAVFQAGLALAWERNPGDPHFKEMGHGSGHAASSDDWRCPHCHETSPRRSSYQVHFESWLASLSPEAKYLAMEVQKLRRWRKQADYEPEANSPERVAQAQVIARNFRLWAQEEAAKPKAAKPVAEEDQPR